MPIVLIGSNNTQMDLITSINQILKNYQTKQREFQNLEILITQLTRKHNGITNKSK